MGPVSPMDFFTLCFKRLSERVRRALRLIALGLLGAYAGLVWSETGVRIESLRLGAVEQSLQLSAQLEIGRAHV